MQWYADRGIEVSRQYIWQTERSALRKLRKRFTENEIRSWLGLPSIMDERLTVQERMRRERGERATEEGEE